MLFFSAGSAIREQGVTGSEMASIYGMFVRSLHLTECGILGEGRMRATFMDRQRIRRQSFTMNAGMHQGSQIQIEFKAQSVKESMA